MAKGHDKHDILRRLSRLEGQIKGVRKMIEEEKECEDIIMQLSAVHSALEGSMKLILVLYLEECLEDSKEEGKNQKDAVSRLAELMLRTKF